MKYCNRCFRNIVEDVTVCPHCGKADKLIDYDGQKRGESFTCSSDSTFSSHIGKDDAYSLGEDDDDIAYGNTGAKHNIDDCENSDNASSKPPVIDPDYFKSLSPQERRRLIAEKQAEIKIRYGANPSEESMNGATVTINGRKVPVEDIRRLSADFDTENTDGKVAKSLLVQALPVLIFIFAIAFMINPGFGVSLLVIVLVIAFNMKNKTGQ